MCNDCWNTIVFISDDVEQLQQLFDNEIAAQNIPDGFLEIIYKGANGIRLKLYSRWVGDLVWFEMMVEKYSKCWIKNEWVAEDGLSGVFVGGWLNGEKQEKVISSWVGLSIETEGYWLSDDHA
jgi:hypothetical protein